MHAQWFDGRSAKAHEVTVQVDSQEKKLIIEGQNIRNEYDTTNIQWPERTRTGSRILRLPDNSTLHAPQGSDWREFARELGAHESAVVRWQQSWPRILTAMCLVAAVAIAGYIWGVPLASRAALAFVPEWVDKKIGDSFMDSVSDQLVGPSTLDTETQDRIRQRFTEMVEKSYLDGSAPSYTLAFHKSKVGPNAFALPGGYIIMTDELVKLANSDDMVLGVLAHELGHVEHRHGMRIVSQSLIVGLLAGLVLGDYADMIATVPLLLGQAAYTRDFERQSDDHSIKMLKASNISPIVMAEFFRKLRQRGELFKVPHKEHQEDKSASDETDNHEKSESKKKDDDHGSGFGILLSSHPADAERIARFENAAK